MEKRVNRTISPISEVVAETYSGFLPTIKEVPEEGILDIEIQMECFHLDM